MDWKNLLNPNRRRQSRLPDDHRAQFERDYDRSIFSTPVKRLQDKAQVFPLEPNDAVRTRLTHSLEVAAVARGLGTSVAAWLADNDEIQIDQQRSVEAIAATCGLIHDLGNPPFGHAGEDAIREWFNDRNTIVKKALPDEQQQMDFFRFEGNAQTLRLVAKLQILADFYGLNLTYGTLSAALKYTAPSNQMPNGRQSHKKPGYFTSEADLVKKVQELTGTGEARNPITFLVEAADDMVYSVADIEDAIKKGLFKWVDLQERFDHFLKIGDHDAEDAIKTILDRKHSILGNPETSNEREMADDIHGSAFRTAAIGYMAPVVVDVFKANYTPIMKGQYDRELVGEQSLKPVMDVFKTIGKEWVYPNKSTVKLELMGRKVIADLMTFFWEGAEKMPLKGKPIAKNFDGRICALLSQNYRDVFQESCSSSGLPEPYHRYQLVTDYVCGMTDTFATQLHSELMNG